MGEDYGDEGQTSDHELDDSGGNGAQRNAKDERGSSDYTERCDEEGEAMSGSLQERKSDFEL